MAGMSSNPKPHVHSRPYPYKPLPQNQYKHACMRTHAEHPCKGAHPPTFVRTVVVRGTAMEGMSSNVLVTRPPDTSTPVLAATTLQPSVSCFTSDHLRPAGERR